MVKGAGWLFGKKDSGAATLTSTDDAAALKAAIDAMDYVFADDLVGLKAVLPKEKSTFPYLARSVSIFIEATLGFEPDVIKEATEVLTTAESLASQDRTNVLRMDRSHLAHAAGQEYGVALAEATLMSAVVLFLTESAVASIRGFYKMRKAYHILADIHQQLAEPGKARSAAADAALADKVAAADRAADEAAAGQASPATEKDEAVAEHAYAPLAARDGETIYQSYISSGVNVCFGMLQLMITLVPPSLGKVLSIVGFRGNKEASIEMLWEATTVMNIHGCVAVLGLLMYFTGPGQANEVVVAGQELPRERCLRVLAEYEAKYPTNALWALQRARVIAMGRDLEGALAILEEPRRTQMRQIEALIVFERAMLSLDLHRFAEAAELFVKLNDINTWSFALYTYYAGVCHLELYRTAVRERPDAVDEAKKHKARANELLARAPTLINKKRFLARAMPLETYLQRKVAKWQARVAAGKGATLADCAGVSPANELMYFTNGYRRAPAAALETSLRELNFHYSDEPTTALLDETAPAFAAAAGKSAFLRDTDEVGARALLVAIVLRSLGRVDEGIDLLKTRVMPIERHDVRGSHMEDWIPPCALYERGIFEWVRTSGKSVDFTRDQLQKAAHYGHGYDLDTRVGLKIQAGLEALKQ
ncbi:outer membrane protein Iml2/Tetratricopeptide repeat protein 39 [Dipodascopsis tothii]|uniref:outer membrane protein Iml2/Tetratricopeptide repeat protein 39 n=1 Tax=Dipodascopsis tothii TaxID=44089 RepID=UPI0034CEF0F9